MKSSRRSFLLNPLSMLLAGLLLGIAARLFDIYFQNLGEIFSQIAIWILLGTGFAIYSSTKKAAMENIFPFCMGMLAAYYVTAAITHGVYSRTFIIGWAVFALTSPVMAYFAWMAKEPGAFSKIIAAGIAAVSVMSSVLLFDHLRLYDFVIDGVLIYILFFKKIKRSQKRKDWNLPVSPHSAYGSLLPQPQNLFLLRLLWLLQ